MALISQHQVWVDGDLITATRLNGVETNIINNGLVPSGIEDFADTDAEMQTQTDPYPGGVISRPTSLQGELERLRHKLAAIMGEEFWYMDADESIEGLTARMVDVEADIEAFYPVGTTMLFYQAAAPTGWTIVPMAGRLMRVDSDNGGVSGGTVDPADVISLAHSHTVNSHTHTTPNHVHPLASYTWATSGAGLGIVRSDMGGTGDEMHVYGVGSAGTVAGSRAVTTSSGNSTSGSTSPDTDSKLADISFAYANVIIATKD